MSKERIGYPPFTAGERIANNMVRVGEDGLWIQEVTGIELRDVKSIIGRIAIEIDAAYERGLKDAREGN